MSDRSDPIVPTILAIADQRHPWQLAPVERQQTRYHTPTTVRVRSATKGELTRQQHHVYCIVDDAAWQCITQARAELQAAIDALANGLRALGSYAKGLVSAGGMKHAKNPLSPSVINVADPDDTSASSWIGHIVPRIRREAITAHTPKMLHGPSATGAWELTFHQRDHFICPTDARWADIEQLHQEATAAAARWAQLLAQLGSYDAALADGRYTPKEPSMQTIQPTTAGALSTLLQDCARRFVAAREQAGAALLEMARELAIARQLAQHGDWYLFLESTGTSADQADRLLDIAAQADRNPAYADAIRRNFLTPTNAAILARPRTPAAVVDQVLAAPTPPTKRQVEQIIQEARPNPAPVRDFNPGSTIDQDAIAIRGARAAIAEAAKWSEDEQPRFWQNAYGYARQVKNDATYKLLMAEIDAAVEGSVPPAAPHTVDAPFWQSMSTSHPMAHLWRRSGMNSYQTACGMTAAHAPVGSTEASHCTSCMRATLQAAPQPALAALPAPATISVQRPRRPASADVSVQLSYIDQLEDYTTQLERENATLRAQLVGMSREVAA